MEQAETDTAVDAVLALVKQILADGIVLQGVQDPDNPNVPAPTKKVGLSHVNVPKMGIPARKAPNKPEIKATASEPFCIEAREFLRKMLVGKTVSFVSTFVVPRSNKEVGMMCLNRDWKSNVAVELVAQGLATVRGGPPNDPYGQLLVAVENAAKERKLNIWSNRDGVAYDPALEAPVDELVQDKDHATHEAVVEHVRDGCSYRLMLLPDYHHVSVQLVGVSNVPGQSAEVARQFAESRLLQRDVEVKLYIPTGVPGTVYGSIATKDGNDIALHLLANGLAKICPWNLKYVDENQKFYREAEQKAQAEGVGFWADKENQALDGKLVESSPGKSLDEPGDTFDAIVIFVNGTEILQIQRIADNRVMQIHLSSVRVNRLQDENKSSVLQLQVPFEVREFLRKWLVGKRCKVHVDYNFLQTQAPSRLKKCCTLQCQGKNVAVELVKRGYATVQRYRNDDVNRSIAYAELLNAEAAYQKGVKTATPQAMPAVNIVRLSGESARARLGIFRQQKNMPAIVEWVLTGSRFVLLVDSTSVLTMSLAGVMCPRTDDQDPELAAMADQALNLSRLSCLQRDVFIQISSLDRSGNCFQGILTLKEAKQYDGNVALMLLSQGLATLHQSATTAPGTQQKGNTQLFARYAVAEKEAREAKRGIWGTDAMVEQETKHETPVNDENNGEPQNAGALNGRQSPSNEIHLSPISTFNAYLSYADRKLNIYVQDVGSVPQARQALVEMSRLLNTRKVEDDSSAFKRDHIVAVRTDGDNWSRAVIRQQQESCYDVFLIDTGATLSKVKASKLRKIPSDCRASSLHPLARQIRLAFVRRVRDEDILAAVRERLAEASDAGKEFSVKILYRIDDINYALLELEDVDINKEFVEKGFVALARPQKIPRRLRSSALFAEYRHLEGVARDARRGIWNYGNWIDDVDDDSTDEEKAKQ